MKIIKSFKYTAAPIKGGYCDRILNIDLGSNDISIMELEPGFKDKYTGGRGYALKLIWDQTTAETRWDSPENLLVMSGGPLCNEPKFPGSGKFVVGTISPLTGTFIDSNVGGFFAPILKTCGFDAIAINGIAEKPVTIIIDRDSGQISIAEAPAFGDEIDRGGISYGTELLKNYTDNKLNKNSAAVTTGFGAVHTRFGIINSLFYDDRRDRIRVKQAGRGGTGTVMRHKRLMGVIVNSSQARTKNNNPADYDGVKNAGQALMKVIKEEDPKQLHLSSWGTPVLVEYMNRFHLLPINNFQLGQHENAKKIFSEVFLKKFLKEKKADGCYFGCNLACAKGAEEVTLSSGPYAGRQVDVDGPEYETAGAVSNLGIFDPHFVMEFNWYCDEYGLDTISMGVSAGFIMECYQRGYLTHDDTGYKLDWGDQENVARLLHETAEGTGIGKICGMGIHRAKDWIAKKHGERTGEPYDAIMNELNKFGMEAKGLEFSMYISRESLAQQGGYGFALKGPQHDEAWLIFLDQVHKEMGTFEMKTAALKWFPLIRTWFNAVGLCKLPWIDVRHPEAANTDNPAQNIPTFNLYIQYINATTGSSKTIDDILFDSERLHLLQKLINLRQGKGNRINDKLPLRAMAPAFLDEYESRAEYYEGWLQEQLDDKKGLPDSNSERHTLLVELREKAYKILSDTVYKSKGYNDDAVPLPETVKQFELYDEQAQKLLEKNGLTEGQANVS